MADRSTRYELLANEEDDEPAQPIGASAVVTIEEEATPQAEAAPPVTTLPIQPAADQEENGNTTESSMLCPPSYTIATDLPSYEEAERTKAEEEARRQAEPSPTEEQVNMSVFSRLLTRSRSDTTQPDSQLGTDGMFLCTFLFAFVFNWIGLIGSLCITQTIAGRLGAMSGFGLSLVKWVAIVKHSNWADGITQGDSWLWWLLIIMGFLIFVRGCTQYIRIKYYWAQLSQNVRNNIFYYF